MTVDRRSRFIVLRFALFPFIFLSFNNLLMGLTELFAAADIFWVSQVVCFGGHVCFFVNAGRAIGTVRKVIAYFIAFLVVVLVCLLGVFPLIAKNLLNVIKARRLCTRVSSQTFDRTYCVIGAGAGGF